jgi:hypothetical protein
MVNDLDRSSVMTTLEKAVAKFGPGIVRNAEDRYEITEAAARKMRINFDDCVYNSRTQRAEITENIVVECLSD